MTTSPLSRLPVSFDRGFHVHRYRASHSEFSLRSRGHDPAGDLVELACYGVLGLKVKTVYQSLVIAHADEVQVEEMLELIEAKPRHRAAIVVLALKSGGRDGLIACTSYTVFSHPGSRSDEARIVSGEDSTLIARGPGTPGQ
ncbi:hypothetical protein H4696_004458 [Amycolatopsis lexingtonensis]|uniref:Uncharacterized protein n=2 Tax=Amycolatopsis lexingtonensis TaxID=218822 RepID=A0ABR9I2J3_9PSEU|nr:hypothetical protein [Amycolatopsis lexingtonensis]MBE1497358.1 hypothetical protein [Amycolatopsis lexingtonensis]